METPEQVIVKIRSAPDEASAMKVLKDCGYDLMPSKDEDSEEMPRKEAPSTSDKWDAIFAKTVKKPAEGMPDAG